MFQQAACYGKAVAVKAAAIEALAITAFVASNDPDVVDKCMTGFANLWKAGVLLLVISSLNTCCLMMHCYVCNLWTEAWVMVVYLWTRAQLYLHGKQLHCRPSLLPHLLCRPCPVTAVSL